MKKQINDWLTSRKKNYFEGLALLQKGGINERIIKRLSSRQNLHQLTLELRKLASKNKRVKPHTPTIIKIVSSGFELDAYDEKKKEELLNANLIKARSGGCGSC